MKLTEDSRGRKIVTLKTYHYGLFRLGQLLPTWVLRVLWLYLGMTYWSIGVWEKWSNEIRTEDDDSDDPLLF